MAVEAEDEDADTEGEETELEEEPEEEELAEVEDDTTGERRWKYEAIPPTASAKELSSS